MSIARSVSRRADCKTLPFKAGTGIVKATHANRGFAVILHATAVGKFDMPTVVLSGTTAGQKFIGELRDVHDDGTCGVEVRDMLLRADGAYAAADNGDVLGTHTVAGVTATASALDDGPIVYGGFTEAVDGADVNFFRAMRLA